MMNTQNVQDTNPATLFEQVVTQMAEQCLRAGIIERRELVITFEDLIQRIERGSLKHTVDTV